MSVDWDSVSALATMGATVVALGLGIFSIIAPERARTRERLEATREVLTAAEESLSIFQASAQQVRSESWNDQEMAALRARADHLRITLDRLISRPGLTDGVITTGAGAMTIVTAIADIPNSIELRRAAQATPKSHRIDEIAAGFVSARPDAERAISAIRAVVLVVEERMARVRDYHNL